MTTDIAPVREMCVTSAAEATEAVTDLQFRQVGIKLLTEQIVNDKVPRQIVLDAGRHQIDSRIVTIPARQGLVFGGVAMPGARQPSAEAIEVTLQEPYTASQQAFTFRPRKYQRIRLKPSSPAATWSCPSRKPPPIRSLPSSFSSTKNATCKDGSTS